MALGLSSVRAADERSEGEPILTLESVTKLPDYATTLAWSPDGAQLLADGYYKGELYVVDPARQSVATALKPHAPWTMLVWSPDRQYLATNYLGRFSGIRLYSVPELKEVARLPSPQQGCSFARHHVYSSSPTLAFTADGRSLWVACTTQKREAFTAALRLGFPDLEPQDSITLDIPIPGGRTIPHQYDFTLVGDMLRLTVIVASYGGKKDAYGGEIPSYFCYGYDLVSKAELFPHFAIRHDDGSNQQWRPAKAFISPDGQLATVLFRGGSNDADQAVGKAREYLVETYDTRTGELMTSFASPVDAELRGAQVEDGLLLPSGLLVVVTGDADTRRGGLVVYDPRTAKVVQWLGYRKGRQPRLSPDRTRLAVIAMDQIRIYRINEPARFRRSGRAEQGRQPTICQQPIRRDEKFCNERKNSAWRLQ